MCFLYFFLRFCEENLHIFLWGLVHLPAQDESGRDKKLPLILFRISERKIGGIKAR